MKNKQLNGIMVLFGSTGDLAKRELFPSLYQLYLNKLLSDQFIVIGASRNELPSEDYQAMIQQSVEEFGEVESFDEDFFKHHVHVAANNTVLEDFDGLLDLIKELKDTHQMADNYLYYYSIAPSIFDETTTNLKQSGIVDLEGEHSVVVEKPFGYDLESAKEYHDILLKTFDEEHIYFMDHFPGMDFVQNILATRFYNPIIEAIWSKDYIENIQISIPENLSIGSRGSFYDENGALLDMFQNHILQVLSLVTMELPEALDLKGLRQGKLDLLKQIPSYSRQEVEENVVRGQYTQDQEGYYKAYTDEEDVPKDSLTETYVALKLTIDIPRWQGVPIYVRTGKALAENFSVVDLVLKDKSTTNKSANKRLTFMFRPGEGLSIVLDQKEAEGEFAPLTTFIGPDQVSYDADKIPSPYENMLYDALEGNQLLFTTWPEIQEQWRITDAIKAAWNEIDGAEQNSNGQLEMYRALSNGPVKADQLLEEKGHEWVKRE